MEHILIKNDSINSDLIRIEFIKTEQDTISTDLMLIEYIKIEHFLMKMVLIKKLYIS